MEPTSLIIQALIAGATKATENIAPDLYQGLKNLIRQKFAGEPTAEMILEEHEQDPKTYEAPLKKKLSETGADQDKQIIEVAKNLLNKLEAEKPASGKTEIVIHGDAQGFQIGDLNKQINTYNS